MAKTHSVLALNRVLLTWIAERVIMYNQEPNRMEKDSHCAEALLANHTCRVLYSRWLSTRSSKRKYSLKLSVQCARIYSR